MEDSGRPLTAKEKRQEQLKRWENSATDVESPVIQNAKPKVKFHDGAVFLAACSSGDLDEVQNLINKGADINFANVDGLTALHQACIDENFEVVEFLVERGAEIDQVDNEGWTPLHAAASCGFMDIAQYLVEKGANVAAVNSEGEVPLDIAEDDEMIDFLNQEIENQGYDIEKARNSERESMVADAKHQLNAVRNGDVPEVYRHPKSGASALHVAAAKGYIDVINILLQAGMDVNLRDNDGWTPLHAASHWSQKEAAKLLADKDAEFTLRSKLGQTPFDVADEDMLEYLQELKQDQEKTRAERKKSELIEPPAFSNNSTKVSTVKTITFEDKHTKKTMKIIENHTIESRQKDINESNHEENSVSSEGDDADSTSSSDLAPSKPPPQSTKEKTPKTEADTFKLPYSSGRTGTEAESVTRLRQSSSGGNVAASTGLSSRNKARPASLYISSTQPKETRPPVLSAVDFTGNRPIAPTQPVQASKSSSNGPGQATGTPNEQNNEAKERTPGSWRLGLRKTGSFDDKMRAAQRGAIGSSFSKPADSDKSTAPKLSEDPSSSGDARTARVAPIMDGRISSKYKNEDNDAPERYSFRPGSSQRGDSSKSTTNPPMTFQRSVAEMSDPFEDEASATSEAATTATSTSSTLSVGDARPDRRRSHLQPVRDEEAEAQRKARSRRERQTRRSTQGVTLDVYEEAKKTIETKKKERADNTASAAAAAAASKKSESELTTPTSAIPHNDSAILLRQQMGSRPVTLPSAYIPSDKRVGSTTKTAPLNTSFSIPSINVPNNTEPDRQSADDSQARADDKDAVPLQSAYQRKTAQQRRQKRRDLDQQALGLAGLATESGIDVSAAGRASRAKAGLEIKIDESESEGRVRRLRKYVRTDEVNEPDAGEAKAAAPPHEDDKPIGPSRSPKLSENRRFKRLHSHDKSTHSERLSKPLNPTPRNTSSRKALDDDEEYNALVSRLHQRIKRKEGSKPGPVDPQDHELKNRVKNLPLDGDEERHNKNANAKKLTEKITAEVKTHKKQPSFVDIFATTKPASCAEDAVVKTEVVPAAAEIPPMPVSPPDAVAKEDADLKPRRNSVNENEDLSDATTPAEKSPIRKKSNRVSAPVAENCSDSNTNSPELQKSGEAIWKKYLILSCFVALFGAWIYWLA